MHRAVARSRREWRDTRSFDIPVQTLMPDGKRFVVGPIAWLRVVQQRDDKPGRFISP